MANTPGRLPDGRCPCSVSTTRTVSHPGSPPTDCPGCSTVGRLRTAAPHRRAAPARADTDLGLPAYGDLVVDEDHDQLFITGGPSANGVVVTDLDGHVKKTITSQYGATGLALSAGNDRFYVALAAGAAISVINAHTRKVEGGTVRSKRYAWNHLG
jgi:hypothetical protein